MAAPKSRFYFGSDDESDDSESIEETPVQQPTSAFSKFMMSSSDDEDDEKRQVLSASQKAKEELSLIDERLQNAADANDWIKVSEAFDDLQKHFKKNATSIYQRGATFAFIDVLIQLEDAHTAIQDDKELRNKFSPTTAKAYNALKQSIRKYIRDFQELVTKLRENPALLEAEKTAEAEAARRNEEVDEEDQDDDDDDDEDDEDDDEFTRKAKKAQKKREQASLPAMNAADVNDEFIERKLKEISAMRGRRGIPTEELLRQLRFLEENTSNLVKKVEILGRMVTILYDTNPAHLEMKPQLWKRIYDLIQAILDIAEKNTSIIIDNSDDITDTKYGPSDDSQETSEGSETVKISANLLAFIERLEDELIKSLQFLDPHTQDYINRLSDEASFLKLAERSQAYYTSKSMQRHVARIASRRLEHIYYKREKEDEATSKLVHNLASQIYTHGDERIRTRAMLCHIYHHALHDRFYQARDLMLMSRLQETITHTDIPTQVLFNRAMAQLGLCAFRVGRYQDAQSCLSEICSGIRVKELLAQGIAPKHVEKTAEQEKAERRRQVPYHMHINLELLESVHLVSCLLLETPVIASSPNNISKLSKPFKRLLDYSEKQVFTGPPENVRDHIVAAMRLMIAGDWKGAFDIIMSIKCWTLVPNLAEMKSMLQKKLQEETLRTFLFTFNTHYTAIKLEQLIAMFGLEENHIHSIVSKMIINDELVASWDQPTNSLVVHREEPTKLQHLALAFAEKISDFVESNEKLLESRSGNSMDDMKQRNKNRNDDDYRQNRFRRQQGRPVVVRQSSSANQYRRPRQNRPNQNS
eukprot:TRINITY_DN1149_c0_g2_i1.p1 TRINITY_DN1149_c0_g2~~TRINITY_DN1149_c0_g2_i1.p1  ORF type:complete len:814 (+),score=243.39 TRINITY_DN1149_c0_g2_i1:56-2497(+)